MQGEEEMQREVGVCGGSGEDQGEVVVTVTVTCHRDCQCHR